MDDNSHKPERGACSEAAARALAEAKARRKMQATMDRETNSEREVGGRKGPEPIRYGDWEKNGIAMV